MDLRDIITLSGGVRELSYRLDLSHTAISLWGRRGIPEKHWPKIIELSKQAVNLEDIKRCNVAVREQYKA
jgi:hypothetical protein